MLHLSYLWLLTWLGSAILQHYCVCIRTSLCRVCHACHIIYIRSVHLCEPCCRREHELASVAAQAAWQAGRGAGAPLANINTDTATSPAAALKHLDERSATAIAHFDGSLRKYALRSVSREYQFMCTNLMQVNVSLMETLNTVPVETGM